MKNLLAFAIVAGVFAIGMQAQPRPANWAGFGSDAQHSGWERTDARISKDTVKDLQLLWKMKLEIAPQGSRPLMPPVILGNLISYRGFKELAFVATNADILYAIDADLGKLFWTKHLEYGSLDPKIAGSSAACPGGLTSMPLMPVPPPRPPAAAGRGPAPAAPAGPPPPRGPFAATGTGSLYVISTDGRLHRINTSTGDDFTQPMQVIPSNADASYLNLADNTLYAVTSHECDDTRDAVWAVDLTAETLKPASYALPAGASAFAGPVIGPDGAVYVQTADAVLALGAKDLRFKHSFKLASDGETGPIVIAHQDRNLLVAGGKDGRLHLLDAETMDPLFETPSLGSSFTGSLAAWQDTGGVAWILAPVRAGAGSNGSIHAFKLEEQGGKLALMSAWTSPNMTSPQGPVIASGVVFALSSAGSRATLFALNAEIGKQLYSSGGIVTAPASLSGMTVANGRVYFGAADGTVYCFGMYMEH